jgi:hypothetical protein
MGRILMTFFERKVRVEPALMLIEINPLMIYGF